MGYDAKIYEMATAQAVEQELEIRQKFLTALSQAGFSKRNGTVIQVDDLVILSKALQLWGIEMSIVENGNGVTRD